MAFLATLNKIVHSRTVWGAVSAGTLIVGQAAPTVAQYLPAGGKLSVILGLIATGVTIYGRIRAKQPLGPVIDTTIAQTLEAVHVLGASDPPADPAKTYGVTTIANPISATGQLRQLAEVKMMVKAIGAQPINPAGAAEHVQ